MAKILLADDDEIVAEMVRRTFAGTNHVIGWLDDGSKALQVIRERRPNLAILDCNMPGMSGINVLRELRKSPDFYDFPVIILTARQGDQDERVSYYEGANGHLRKPFRPETLVSQVETLLSGARPRAGF